MQDSLVGRSFNLFLLSLFLCSLTCFIHSHSLVPWKRLVCQRGFQVWHIPMCPPQREGLFGYWCPLKLCGLSHDGGRVFHANYYERVTKREGVDGGRVTQVLSLAFKQVMWAAVENSDLLERWRRQDFEKHPSGFNHIPALLDSPEIRFWTMVLKQ